MTKYMPHLDCCLRIYSACLPTIIYVIALADSPHNPYFIVCIRVSGVGLLFGALSVVGCCIELEDKEYHF